MAQKFHITGQKKKNFPNFILGFCGVAVGKIFFVKQYVIITKLWKNMIL